MRTVRQVFLLLCGLGLWPLRTAAQSCNHKCAAEQRDEMGCCPPQKPPPRPAHKARRATAPPAADRPPAAIPAKSACASVLSCSGRCEKGDAASCFQTGEDFRLGSGIDSNPVSALDFYRRACEQDHGAGCLLAGLLTRESAAIADKDKLALERFKRGCALNNAESCYWTASSSEVAVVERFSVYFAKACDLGHARSCQALGEQYAKTDKERAFKYYLRGCDLGGAKSCRDGAYAARSGDGVAKSGAQSSYFYARAAAAGDASAFGGVSAGEMAEETPAERKRWLPILKPIDARCVAGDARACNIKGILALQSGRLQEAASLFDRACAMAVNPEAEPCENRELANAMIAVAGNDTSRAAALLLQRCEAGDGKACEYAAMAAAGAYGVERSPLQASVLHKKACDLGIARACVAAGGDSEYAQNGAAKEPDLALKNYQRACDAGYGAGCWLAGIAYNSGTGVAKDQEKAQALFEKSCEAGSGGGCCFAGVYYIYDPVKPATARAALMLTRGCELGYDYACEYAGNLYMEPKFPGTDLAKAFSFYRKGCDLWDATACRELAGLLERAEFTNPEASAKSDARACELSAGYCSYAAERSVLGKGRLKNAVEAAEFYKRGCEVGGEENSCRRYLLIAPYQAPRVSPSAP